MCEFKQRMKDNFISEMNTFFNESYQIISILKSCIELLLVYLISALGFVSSVQIFALILFFVFFR
jgi:hypothetical protein